VEKCYNSFDTATYKQLRACF